MERGYLSDYFRGVAAKRLSAVEADGSRSHQHEFNGVTLLKKLFGTARTEKITFHAQFIYLNDEDDEPVTDTGSLTWYDARRADPKRTEHRMYYPTTTVSSCMAEGDGLFIGLCQDGGLLVIIAEGGSTICNQLFWLFGIEESDRFHVRDDLDTDQYRLAFASRLILEQIGVRIAGRAEDHLDEMIREFGSSFPTTREFSDYARKTLPHIHAKDDPDMVLMAWMEQEEALFRTFEEHIVSSRLTQGFDRDVDGFFRFALSALNRRKSRAGQALENHVEKLLDAHGIRYDRTKVTENHARPDFIFPGIREYHDRDFDARLLTMLGAKSTCKDRWRQVLSEADRICEKHLLTLEAAISTHQTDEMRYHHLRLVVPRSLHGTYTPEQQDWLMDVREFMEQVQFRQRASDCQ